MRVLGEDRSQGDPRLSGGVFGCGVSLPVGGRLLALELLVVPSHPGLDLIEANILAAGQQDLADQPPVGLLFAGVEIGRLPENEPGEVLPRALPNA